jgi:hypothetical protein
LTSIRRLASLAQQAKISVGDVLDPVRGHDRGDPMTTTDRFPRGMTLSFDVAEAPDSTMRPRS